LPNPTRNKTKTPLKVNRFALPNPTLNKTKTPACLYQANPSFNLRAPNFVDITYEPKHQHLQLKNYKLFLNKASTKEIANSLQNIK
jgi:hypothetical protein